MPEIIDSFIGLGDAAQRIRAAIETVAPSDRCVLIVGETGTGKEIIARALHQRSGRASWMALQCNTVPEDLIESELFGHARGAFSGAFQPRVGLVEEASDGTLFLDELQDMPLEMQAKLLRFLQEKRFRRVGENRERGSAVRIIAACNRDPMQLIEAGLLRQDLYFRLDQYSIRSPPLRERREDVAVLAAHFLALESRRGTARERRFDEGALEALRAYAWPGNVRELVHAIGKAVVDARDEAVIRREHLPAEIESGANLARTLPARPAVTGETPAARGERPASVRLRALGVVCRAIVRRTVAAQSVSGPFAAICPLQHQGAACCRHSASDILSSDRVCDDTSTSISESCATAFLAEAVLGIFEPALEPEENFYTHGSTNMLRWIVGTHEKQALTDEALRGRAKRALRRARETCASTADDPAEAAPAPGLRRELELYRRCFPRQSAPADQRDSGAEVLRCRALLGGLRT